MKITFPDKMIRFRLGISYLWSHQTILDLIFIAFIITYGLVGLRNFELRMANMQSDDGPILYAHAFKTPALFEGDLGTGLPMQIRVPLKVVTTAMNWIPALLWRYLDIGPYLTTWLITLIQGFSIGLSIYILTLSMVGERTTAILAAIFAFVATPWGWDPANYGGGARWNFIPYPANLALAPVLLAFACLIYGRDKAVLLLLIIAGLIHPNVTLYACAIVGIYWLWEGIQSRSPAILGRLVGLVVVGIITILPAILVKITLSGAPVSQAEFIAGMRHNQHVWPWGYKSRWDRAWPTEVKWLTLAILSWRWHIKFSNNVQRLWVTAVVAVFLLSLSHVIGGIWQIPTLLNLIGLRSFIWLALISLPLVMHYWYAHLHSGNWLGAVLSMLCLALPLYAREYALFWLLIVGLLLVDTSRGYLSVWNFGLPTWARHSLLAMALLTTIVWSISFLVMPFGSEADSSLLLKILSQLTWGWNIIGELPSQPARIKLVVTIAVLALIIWGFGWLTTRKNSASNLARHHNALWIALSSLIIVLYGSRFLWTKWQEAEIERISPAAHLLDTQLWARKQTSPSSLFVFPPSGGWRMMSLRRQLDPFTQETSAYITNRQAKEHRDRLLTFYDISKEEGIEFRGNRVYQMEVDRFQNFRESDFLRFATEFGATHLVLPKFAETTPLDLFQIYENKGYVVYSLEPYPYETTLQQFHLETALSDALLDLDFSNLTVENQETYALAKTWQTTNTVGPVQVGEGPWVNSSALMVNETIGLTIPSDGIDLSQGSLSFWLRVIEFEEGYRELICVNNETDLNIALQSDGRLLFRYNGTNLATTTAITDKEWHHYLFTWQDREQRFYMDGDLLASATEPASTAATELFAINRFKNSTGEQWRGLLAGLTTFNRPLTLAELTALYEASESVRQTTAWYQDNSGAAAATWLALAWAYYEQQDYIQARPVFERVIALDPDNIEGHLGKELTQGLSFLTQERYSETVEILNRAIESGTNLKANRLAQAYAGLGTAYCQMGQTEECLRIQLYATNLDAGSWNILTDDEQQRLSQVLLSEVWKDLRLAVSDVVTEGKETYLVIQTGQKIKIEGTVQVVEGPWPGSSAVVVNEATRLIGPTDALRLDQGSVSMWARLTDDSSPYVYLVRVNDKDLHIYRRGDTERFQVIYNGINLGLSSVIITDNDWHHYLLTWQDGEQELYIDGKPVLSGTAPASQASIDHFAIGWVGSGHSYLWSGPLAEFATFSRALTPAESMALYKMGIFAQRVKLRF
ncbi:LamG-like jellyroll fold domain-containing protein [Chloroflexota bacterium]